MAVNGYSDDYNSPWLDGQQDPMQQAASAPSPIAAPDPIATPTPAAGSAPGGSSTFSESAPTSWLADTSAAPADPAAAAVAQDQRATSVQQQLEADGHDVSYDNAGNMVVDGRKYEVADPHSYDPTGLSSGQPDTSNGTPPDPNLGAPNVPAPGNDANQIQGWYSQFLGRTASDAEIQSHLQNPGGLGAAMNLIANSPEAQAYAAKQAHLDTPPPGPAPPTGGTAGAVSGSHVSLAPVDVPPWLQDAPTYQPGAPLDTALADMPGFADLYAQASQPTPHEAELDALVSNILQHPESLSEQDVATLKAKSAESAAVAAQAQDEDLQHFGFAGGLSDSPWLAGQRAQTSANRRNTTIQADQSVDIAAADRRSSDRLAAAGLGTSYATYQSGRHTAALNLALDGALAKFGEQRNRTALNASMDQAAAASGQSKAQLVASYVLGATGQEIDVAKLNQQGDQFMQDLAFRVSQLKTQSDQFDAQMQLALQQFQHAKDNDAWTQAQATYGA